jgi:carboxylesterase
LLFNLSFVHIQTGSDAFFYNGGKTGILLIHGFTATPFIFQELGHRLSALGYTVSAPLIVGHGTSPDELAQTSWEDWYNSIEEAYIDLSHQCDEVFVLGASFGANLALLLASRFPTRICGIITIGLARRIQKQLLAKTFTPIFRAIGLKYFTKKYSRQMQGNSVLGGPNHAYRKIPIKSVGDFFACIATTNKELLKKVKAPALIIQSRNDGLVTPGSGVYALNHLGSLDKELIWVNSPHHELHMGKEKEIIFKQIENFVRNYQQKE